jgi:hypothetical protein
MTSGASGGMVVVMPPCIAMLAAGWDGWLAGQSRCAIAAHRTGRVTRFPNADPMYYTV